MLHGIRSLWECDTIDKQPRVPPLSLESLKLHLSPKDFWSTVHKMSPGRQRIPNEVSNQSVSASTPCGKANIFNTFSTLVSVLPLQLSARLISPPHHLRLTHCSTYFALRRRCITCCQHTSSGQLQALMVFLALCYGILPPQLLHLSLHSLTFLLDLAVFPLTG